MTAIQPINPSNFNKPLGHYSYAVRAGDFIFVSGLLPALPDGQKLTGASFEDQAKQTLQNLDDVLRAAGVDRSKLVQVRVYLTDIEEWGAFNAIYAEWMGEHRPARCVVPVPQLHYGLAMEIEATAFAG